jgi:hypothetical protein
MATYVNDLRLKEIGTGESSGTWGTETNTNLELIGEALGYATEGITTNADTHATTVADGSTDPGRAMYIKYTGTLDSACTITIGPNTMSRVHIIENATSGSQNIIIKQGSGAEITIPNGFVKAVYLDGAGSGAAVTEAFDNLSVGTNFRIGNGAAEDTSLVFDGNAQDFYIGLDDSADDLLIGLGSTVGTTPAISIDENLQSTLSGKVVIDPADGVADDAYALFVRNNEATDGRNYGLVVRAGSTSADESFSVRDHANASVYFKVQGDGKLLVNHSASVSQAGVAPTVQVHGTGSATSSISAARNSNDTGGPYLILSKSRGTSVGAVTVVQDGDILGQLMFAGADGGDLAPVGASIQAIVDGTPGTNDMPGKLVFSTTSDGAQTATARLTISAGGTATFEHPIVVQSGATQGYYIENNAGNATTPRITNDANDHTVIRPGKSSGAVQFNNFANDAELMRLTDGGKLGLGVSPDYKLHIYASDSGASAHANADDLFIESSGHAGMTIGSGSSSNGSIFFADSESTIVGQIEYNHADNLINFIAGGSTSVRVSSSGLLFGGDTAAANTLNDYEEGSFTIDTDGGDFSGGTSNHTAYYTKIGQLVRWYWYSGASTIANSSGNATLTGLPFTTKGAGYTLFQFLHGTGVDGNSTGGYVNVSNTNAVFVDENSTALASFIDGSSKYVMVGGEFVTDS